MKLNQFYPHKQKYVNMQSFELGTSRSSYEENHRIIQHEGKLGKKIERINSKAIDHINQEQYPEALQALEEAEKLLEYAANYGKEIDRFWIIATFSNQACTLQKMWSFDECLDYLEGVIINLQRWLNDTESQTTLESQLERQNFRRSLNLKLLLCLHRLQFSALASQINIQEQALKSAHQALKGFKDLIKDIVALQKHKYTKNSDLCMGIAKILQGQSNYDQINIQSIIKQMQQALYEIQNYRYFLTFDPSKLQEFTISHVLQISPKSLEDFKQRAYSLPWFISQEGLTQIALYISTCFFVISTQLRILSQVSSVQEQLSSQIINEYFFDTISPSKRKLSTYYHLKAIKIGSVPIKCETSLLKHIVLSFKNNYQIDLFQRQEKNGKEQTRQSEPGLKNAYSFYHNKTTSAEQQSSQYGAFDNKENILMYCNIHSSPSHDDLQQKGDKKTRKQKDKKSRPKKTKAKISLFTLADKSRCKVLRQKSSGSNKSYKKTEYRKIQSKLATPTQPYMTPRSPISWKKQSNNKKPVSRKK